MRRALLSLGSRQRGISPVGWAAYASASMRTAARWMSPRREGIRRCEAHMGYKEKSWHSWIRNPYLRERIPITSSISRNVPRSAQFKEGGKLYGLQFIEAQELEFVRSCQWPALACKIPHSVLPFQSLHCPPDADIKITELALLMRILYHLSEGWSLLICRPNC